MRTIAIAILAGVGALSVGSAARASDIIGTTDYATPGSVQQVRMICDEDGRCYRSRAAARACAIPTATNQPRERYIERRTYRDRDWDDGPRAGVGIRAPGVSVGVGVGVGNDRW